MKIIMLLLAFCVSGCSRTSPEKVFSNYYSGNKPYVYQYVEQGGNVCIYDSDRNVTLLTRAVLDKDDRLIASILSSRTYSIPYEMEHDFTFLHAAASENNLAVLRRVLPDISDINIPEGATAITPLVHTIVARHPEAMELLLKHPTMDVNYTNPKDKGKLSAAHIAAARGNLDAVKLLLSYGADFSQRNGSGQTPLELARNRLLECENKAGSSEKIKAIQEVIDFLHRPGND